MWISNDGRIELLITEEQARIGSHPGQCLQDIKYLRMLPEIAQQLSALDPEQVKDALREYGAWEESELLDHDLNLDRLLWIACGDIVEELREVDRVT